MIEIADEVYGMDGYTANEAIIMTGVFESEVGIQTLQRVADRFMYTGDDGVEYEDIEVIDERGVYTPNYTTPPKVTEFGIEFCVDCKGVISDPMGTTFSTDTGGGGTRRGDHRGANRGSQAQLRREPNGALRPGREP